MTEVEMLRAELKEAYARREAVGDALEVAQKAFETLKDMYAQAMADEMEATEALVNAMR